MASTSKISFLNIEYNKLDGRWSGKCDVPAFLGKLAGRDHFVLNLSQRERMLPSTESQAQFQIKIPSFSIANYQCPWLFTSKVAIQKTHHAHHPFLMQMRRTGTSRCLAFISKRFGAFWQMGKWSHDVLIHRVDHKFESLGERKQRAKTDWKLIDTINLKLVVFNPPLLYNYLVN